MYSELIASCDSVVSQIRWSQKVPDLDSSEKMSENNLSSSSFSNRFVSFRQILRRIRTSIGLSTVRSYEFHENSHHNVTKTVPKSLTTTNNKSLFDTLDGKNSKNSIKIKSNKENDAVDLGTGVSGLNIFHKNAATVSAAAAAVDSPVTSSIITTGNNDRVAGTTRYYTRNVGRKDRRSTKATSLQRKRSRRLLSAGKASSCSSSTATLLETGSHHPPPKTSPGPSRRQVERERRRGGIFFIPPAAEETAHKKILNYPVCEKQVVGIKNGSCIYVTNV